MNLHENAKYFAKVLREEAEKTKDPERQKACTEFANHWEKQAAFHLKYRQWGFLKSTLLLPIWIWREYKFTRELAALSEEANQLANKCNLRLIHGNSVCE